MLFRSTLLGALAAVEPARAEVLVNNFHLADRNVTLPAYSIRSRGQPFSTGPGTYGWALDSIEITVEDAPDDTDDVTVEVRKMANSVTPSSTVTATLSNPSEIQRGVNVFTAPPGTTLEAGSLYVVLVHHDNTDTGDFELDVANGTGEQSGHGWSIDDNSLVRSIVGTNIQHNLSGNVLKIRVNGEDLDDTSVTGFEMLSVPEDGESYRRGEWIEIGARFDQEVDVDGGFLALFVGPDRKSVV